VDVTDSKGHSNGAARTTRILTAAICCAVSGSAGRDRLDGGSGRDFLMARDGVGGDIVTCTRVNLRRVAQRLQRDVVVADRRDAIRNREWCARISIV
jgi:hypothetical protein